MGGEGDSRCAKSPTPGTKKIQGRRRLPYHITEGRFVDVGVSVWLRFAQPAGLIKLCLVEGSCYKKEGLGPGYSFWVFVLSILLRLVLLHPRHSYLGNRYWLGWGMGWSQRKRCWVVGVCRGAAAGQGWPMPRFVWILGGCWVGAKTTTGLTDTAWMGLSGCRE